MKTGPPITAVIIPTGISVGDMMVLATVSQITSSTPPDKNEHGSITRWSEPFMILQMCGTIKPMKLIGPAIETTAAVAIAPPIKQFLRTLGTSTPWPPAVNSPSDK